MLFNKIKIAYYEFFLHLTKGTENSENQIHDDELIESVSFNMRLFINVSFFHFIQLCKHVYLGFIYGKFSTISR